MTRFLSRCDRSWVLWTNCFVQWRRRELNPRPHAPPSAFFDADALRDALLKPDRKFDQEHLHSQASAGSLHWTSLWSASPSTTPNTPTLSDFSRGDEPPLESTHFAGHRIRFVRLPLTQKAAAGLEPASTTNSSEVIFTACRKSDRLQRSVDATSASHQFPFPASVCVAAAN